MHPSNHLRSPARTILAGVAIVALVLLEAACSGNARVSVGGSVHRTSGGGWGHSIGVGIHSNGRR